MEKNEKTFSAVFPSIKAGLRSTISVPLISKDEVIGVLHFRSTKPNAYTERDLRLAERVGNQIAGAIANAQLFTEHKQAEEALQRSEESAKRLAHENAIMAEIGRIISSTLNIEEVYERFAEEVRKLIPFDRISINIINPEDNTTTISYVTGVDIPGLRVGDTIPLPGTVTEKCMRSRSSLLIQTENTDESVIRSPRLLSSFRAGLRSMIFVPLISKDQVIGVLLLQLEKMNAYSIRDSNLAESISTHIAGAIANAQLFKDHKRAEEEIYRQSALLDAINKVFREVLMCETEEELASMCLSVTEKLTGSKFGFIGELNQAGLLDTLAISNPGWDACKMSKSEASLLIKNMEVRGIWGSVLKNNQSIIC